MSLNNIFGFHSAFYYYSNEHLFVNLLRYVKQGFDNNEAIYILTDKERFNNFINFLEKYNVSTNKIFLLNKAEFDVYKNTSNIEPLLDTINKKLLNILELTTKNGFSGIRFIHDCSYMITLTSKDFFLNLDRNITNIIKYYNISVLCVYDVYDFINNSNKKDIINKDIINNSFYSHSHLLKNFNLRRINNDKETMWK